jgi:hypothetical protein
MRALPILLAATLTACGGGGFAAPDLLDGGGLVKVDRTVENDLMTQAAGTLRRLGLRDTLGAAYDYDVIPYKPVFFLGAGHGEADRQELMNEALPHFGGEQGPIEAPADYNFDGTTFLCAPYSHTGVPGTEGTGGLASIAAVCTWSDGELAGFGIGVAGVDVQQVLGWSAEARRSLGGGS